MPRVIQLETGEQTFWKQVHLSPEPVLFGLLISYLTPCGGRGDFYHTPLILVCSPLSLNVTGSQGSGELKCGTLPC